MHARRAPARNVFRYPVSYWLLDLDELPELERRLRLSRSTGANVVSLRDATTSTGPRRSSRRCSTSSATPRSSGC